MLIQYHYGHLSCCVVKTVLSNVIYIYIYMFLRGFSDITITVT